MSRAALAAISHGTSDPAGQAVVARLAADVAAEAARRGHPEEVRLGHVDVQDPDVAATLAALSEGTPAVVVPVLLSAGYHVNVDLARETADVGREVTISGALGPDDRLVELLAERLEAVGADPRADTILLGAAGSSDPAAVDDCRDMSRRLAARLDADVEVAFLSAAEPRVRDAVAAARRERPQRRVVVASYLLAPGYFQDLLVAAGADVTAAPLLPAPEGPGGAPDSPRQLIEIMLDRFAAGERALTARADDGV